MRKCFLRITMICTLLCFHLQVGAQENRSASIVTIDGIQYYVHSVEAGQTLYSLARMYSVSEDDIVKSNPHVAQEMKSDQVLKIPVKRDDGNDMNKRQLRRTFDVHRVVPGETLYAISRTYGISINTLLEDNEGLDPAHLAVGSTINIRKQEQNETTGWQITEELEEYRDALNSVSSDAVYHLVKSGETLYSLSKMYEVDEGAIVAANRITNGLKAGALIKIPGVSAAPDKGGENIDGGEVTDDADSRDPGYYRNLLAEKSDITVRDISYKNNINISLLLPLKDDKGKVNPGFVEFYQGFLLGLEDLKRQGRSSTLTLYNTGRSETEVLRIVAASEFADTDIIIGPIYEEGIREVLEFAEGKEIAVISPLALNENVMSPVLYQMPPDASTKYDKVVQMMAREGVNVIYVSTEHKDADMEAHLRTKLPATAQILEYRSGIHASAFERRFARSAQENIFIVSCENEFMVDEILAKISSVQNNLSARSISAANVRVVGSARWARFQNIVDRELYFKLRVCYVTSYHADRGDSTVKEFDRRYIGAYNSLPSLYSYRGYDAAKLFVGAAMTPGDKYDDKIKNYEAGLLAVSYDMRQLIPGADYRNINWPMVYYSSDYTIEVR